MRGHYVAIGDGLSSRVGSTLPLEVCMCVLGGGGGGKKLIGKDLLLYSW